MWIAGIKCFLQTHSNTHFKYNYKRSNNQISYLVERIGSAQKSLYEFCLIQSRLPLKKLKLADLSKLVSDAQTTQFVRWINFVKSNGRSTFRFVSFSLIIKSRQAHPASASASPRTRLHDIFHNRLGIRPVYIVTIVLRCPHQGASSCPVQSRCHRR